MSKRLYLAALFSEREKMEGIANSLKKVGFEITARWVFGGEEGLSREQIALIDIADVDLCDTLVAFTQPRGTLHTGGGRHVETGYALARGKNVVVIGERENVFHHHPAIQVYPTLDAWLHAVLLV